MLSTAADVLSLVQLAPWLAVGVLALVAAAWVYRQSRRGLAEARRLSESSAARQGRRLGELEKLTGLLDLRRRQVEWALLDEGVELPPWPPDGPQQPHARPRPRPSYEPYSGPGPWPQDGVPLPHGDVDEDLADDDLGPETLQRRIPVPPLDPAVAARHRRDLPIGEA